MSDISFLHRVGRWILRIQYNDLFMRRIGLILSIAAILSGIATYFVLTESGNFDDKSGRVLPFIYLDLTLLLLLSVIIAKRVVELWMERRRGSAGSKLHVQIALLFAFVAITPGICVTVFSALFFDVGVKAWFSEPVRQALSESKFVAEAYLKEHSKAVALDGEAVRKQLASNIFALEELPEILSDKLTQLCEVRGLDEALIFNSDRDVIARSLLTFTLDFEKVSEAAYQEAERGEIAVVLGENEDRVRALLRIDEDTNLYLYVGKTIDPDVLKHVVQTRSAIVEYQRLDSQRLELQITFIIIFSVVALLLLLASIWAGLTVANLFVRPISRLISAADEVSRGNLEVQVVSEGSLNNELGNLSQAFNRMISQLHDQRKDLVKASIQIDQRRQFMEAILSHISAGVISIEKDGRINLMNRRAHELLSYQKMMGAAEASKEKKVDIENLSHVAPEIFGILEDFESVGEEVLSRQVSLVRKGIVRSLQIVVVVDQSRRQGAGYIVTFDDVTPLLVAQRQAAWSDVARKIAHEIKNPLTPIQLSAERLKRKYLKEIHTDPETFAECINTIIRQVTQIGKLVTEFSGFARMPEPVMRPENIIDLVKQALFLQRQAHASIHFEFKTPLKEFVENFYVNCDANQIGQVLTNLFQNAINAVSLDEFIQQKIQKENEGNIFVPTILVTLELNRNRCRIIIEDNGPGLPIEGRERLIDPYYTTHKKGTGLGLAIVAKIVEDHRGTLELLDSDLGGAKMVVEIPLIKQTRK